MPIEGGVPVKLPIPHAWRAAISPDGGTIAYQPIGEASNEWKNYRGGQASRIVLFDTKSYATEKIPQPEGRCNDIDPRWVGKRWFTSAPIRTGNFNLYSFDPATSDQPDRTGRRTNSPSDQGK